MNDYDTYQTDTARWEAVVQRDPEAADAFVYAVVTTGIYCRPGCPSRLPNRENVRFHDSWESAEAAGFRPCKRCTPQSPAESDAGLRAVIDACRIIEAAERSPSLRELADAVGYSPYHFQRLFKERVGITPKQYAMEKRADRVREGLQAEPTVTQAIYGAGFESAGRFYESAAPVLGMKPSQYKHGAEGLSIRYALAQSYLGWVLVAATEQGICRIDFGNTPEALVGRLRADFPRADLQTDSPGFDTVVHEVLALLEAPDRGLSLPLDIQGTAFQRRVWSVLQQIPAGATASYSEIAAKIGSPKGARAVAQACASNRLAVAVPCHRVVRSDGGLGGYRWGLERKRAILERESA
ncbi:MAG: bifunctional DNA-binding transcriptional regulator/O6-methylguanine-DNA methyltransferase Ada [Anaerolineae bacterium]|nr:bifunctional DNA-binding transcriptional regulator/O6-methylguanine-DNA methyltransferase Ada [Anaerolineae bacterium]